MMKVKKQVHLLRNTSKMCSVSGTSCVVFLVLFVLAVFGGAESAKSKSRVTINKCCRIGDHLTTEKVCSAGGSERWVPKIYMPQKGIYFNKTGFLPPFMKADEEIFPSCKSPDYFPNSNFVVMANGSLFLGEKHLMVDPENYCVEQDSALICFDDHLGDPESLIEAEKIIKVRKCCGPGQAYNEKSSSPCINLDKSHTLYNNKLIQGHRIDWSYKFPECSNNEFAMAGKFSDSNFDSSNGNFKMESGKELEADQYCLDNVVGETNHVHVFVCSHHFQQVPIQAPATKDIRFTIYAIGLLISVVFLLATLAVGSLLLSNHHVLHWRCQTNYVLCLLIGDFLLAITQIAGNSLTGVPLLCISIGK